MKDRTKSLRADELIGGSPCLLTCIQRHRYGYEYGVLLDIRLDQNNVIPGEEILHHVLEDDDDGESLDDEASQGKVGQQLDVSDHVDQEQDRKRYSDVGLRSE